MRRGTGPLRGAPDTRPAARWVALAGLWLSYTAFGTTVTSLAPLLPEIRAELQTTNATLGAVLGAWPLVYILMAIPAGAFLDFVGARTGVFLAMLFVALSALLRAMADTPLELLVAVAIFGIGGPLISAGAPKLITAHFEGKTRGTALGIYMTGPNIGAILTLLLTANVLLPLAGSWRGVMMIHAALALVAGVAWFGAATWARVSAAAGPRERFEVKALKGILAKADVLVVLVIAAGCFYINHAMNNWLPAILRNAGMDASRAGTWSAIPNIVGLAAALTVPRLATGARRLPIFIALCVAAAGASLFIAAGPGSGLIPGLILQGLVRGAMISIAILVMVDLPSVPASRIGLASGIFFAVGEVGGVIGPLTFGILRDATGAFHAPLYSLAAVAVIMAGLALWLALRLPAAPARAE